MSWKSPLIFFFFAPGDKQSGRQSFHVAGREGVRVVPTILRHRSAERSPLREEPTRGEAEPGAARPRPYDLRGAEHHRARRLPHTHAYAVAHPVPEGAGQFHPQLPSRYFTSTYTSSLHYGRRPWLKAREPRKISTRGSANITYHQLIISSRVN